MFIAALLAIAKTWKPTKCASTDEWIKKMWYIYISIQWNITPLYKKAIKKNEILLFATMWMDLGFIILSEISQRKTNIMISLVCRI